MIQVNPIECSLCGVCASVCPSRIIEPPHGQAVPHLLEGREAACLRCGHCETHCPSEALSLDYRPDERVERPANPRLSAQALGDHLRNRRSVRQYSDALVPKETLAAWLDLARSAPTGSNRQPVQWMVFTRPEDVRRVAELSMDWFKAQRLEGHPMQGYIPTLLRAWEAGTDPICRGAPHLVVAHIPEGNPVAAVDALIALSHLDLAAPAFELGTCWAGLVSMAVKGHEPLRAFMALPPGRAYAYSLLCGTPRFQSYGVARREPLVVDWRA